MYHCHVCFYFIGNESQLFEIIRCMPALPSSEYEFIENKSADRESASRADVILADLREMNAVEAVRNLTAWKK